MPWIELSLDTHSEAVDWVCTLLASTRYQGEIRVVDYAQELGGNWAFTIYLYLPEDAQIQAQEIADILLPLHRTGIATELQMRKIEDEPRCFADTARVAPSFIHRVGNFVILTDDRCAAAADEVTLQIKPSQAFGSAQPPVN
jgi:ribosomal protein L11 methyltransferase